MLLRIAVSPASAGAAVALDPVRERRSDNTGWADDGLSGARAPGANGNGANGNVSNGDVANGATTSGAGKVAGNSRGSRNEIRARAGAGVATGYTVSIVGARAAGSGAVGAASAWTGTVTAVAGGTRLVATGVGGTSAGDAAFCSGSEAEAGAGAPASPEPASVDAECSVSSANRTL